MIDQKTLEILTEIVYKEHSAKKDLPKDMKERKTFFKAVETDTAMLAGTIHAVARLLKEKEAKKSFEPKPF